MISKAELGERVRKLREKRGYSRYRVMHLSGVSHGTIDSIENGQVYPRVDTLLCIAEALDCTISELTEERNG